MINSVTIKRDHTTRIPEALATETGMPIDLTGKSIIVRLVSGATMVELTESAGVGFSNEAAGQYWWEVTAANLGALGDPERIDVYLTMFEADNSVYMEDAMTVNVSW